MNMFSRFAASIGADPAAPATGQAKPALVEANALEQNWLALHEAAAAVRLLAGLRTVPLQDATDDFPARIQAIGGWRLKLAEQGIEDLFAIMEAGLTALLALHQRGENPIAAALALSDEFDATRQALAALAEGPANREPDPPR